MDALDHFLVLRKYRLWWSMASTSVVLPWSMCAMIATFRFKSFPLFMVGFSRFQAGAPPGRDTTLPSEWLTRHLT